MRNKIKFSDAELLAIRTHLFEVLNIIGTGGEEIAENQKYIFVLSAYKKIDKECVLRGFNELCYEEIL